MSLQKCALNLNRTGKELQPHGTLEFPCAGYSEQYEDNPEENIPWHWHEEMEIIYIKSGGMKVQVPGKSFHIRQGQVLVINSNVLHYGEGEPYCHLQSLVFDPLLVTGGDQSVMARRYVSPLINCVFFDGCLLDNLSWESGGGLDGAGQFLKAFEAFSQEEPGYEFRVRERLSHICMELYRYYQQETAMESPEMDQDGIRMRKMLDYIHAHYSENLDLGQVAKAADIGERECLRCFKRAIQTSPIQYLLKYRISQGASMLLQDRSSIGEISSRCGFDSPSNFSQMFKRFHMCTPREYRKNC